MSRLLAMIAGADTARGHDTPISKKEVAVFLSSLLGLMAAAFYLELEYPLFLAVLGSLAGLLVLQSAVAWIAVSILAFTGVFWTLQEGLTPPEILHTVIYYGGLIWWFFHRIVIARKPVHWTLGGMLSAALFLQMALMAPLSILYGADPYVWMRELVIVSTVLMLVPIAHECNTRVKQYIVGAALLAMLSAFALKNLFLYKQKVVEAVWMWQVGASRAAETAYLIFALAVFGAALLVAARGRAQLLLWASLFTLGVSATVLSFYRTIWVGALASYFFMAVLMGRDFFRRAAGYASIGLVVLAAMYPIFLADVVPLDVMWGSISERFESIGSYRTDVSVTNRDAEARAMLDDIGANWLLGKGIATTIHFTKLTSMTTIYPTWTHNGYAWVLNHYGILGTLLIFGSWLAYAALGWRIERRLRRVTGGDDADRYRVRALTAAGVALILATFIISITINQFISHESGVIMAVIFGLLEAWGRETADTGAGA